MPVKTERIEARLSPEERARIEQAASTQGVSVSTFVVGTAVDRADQIIAEATSTTVPVEYFDRVLTALDDPDPAPRLAKAARRVARSGRIHQA